MKKLFFLSIILFGIACDNAFTPEYSLAWEPPVIYSAILTDEFSVSKEIIFSEYGYEASVRLMGFNEVKDLSLVANPLIFKEQEGPSTNLVFVTLSSSIVRVFVMPARFPFEEEGAVFNRLQSSPLVELRKGGLILFEGELSAGSHAVPFNASDFPSGPYVYYIETEDRVWARKLILYRECREAHPQLRPHISQCN